MNKKVSTQDNACEYCKDYGVKLLSERQQHYSDKGDFYPGVEVYIDKDTLNVFAVADTYEPGVEEACIKIQYCPMCGRKLPGMG